MKNWWKYATVSLLVYVVIFSLITPLGPGIASLDREELPMGTTQGIVIKGYNTDFTKSTVDLPSPILWVESDGKPICAENTKVLSANELQFDLSIPVNIPSKLLDLYVQYGEGVIYQSNAYRVKDAGQDNIYTQPCMKDKVTYLNEGMRFPNREILYETIRNLMFHVPMWFAMMVIMFISVYYSIRYLNGFDVKYDIIAREAINLGIFFGLLGVTTGSLWARYTWGQWWVPDPKLNGAAITTLVYLAYLVLRGSIQEERRQGNVAAVYNIFAFVLMVVLLMVLPRLTDSLHPGNGGNPAFSQYDLDSTLRMVFYPAVIGWIGLSVWLLQLRIRLARINQQLEL